MILSVVFNETFLQRSSHGKGQQHHLRGRSFAIAGDLQFALILLDCSNSIIETVDVLNACVWTYSARTAIEVENDYVESFNGKLWGERLNVKGFFN